MKWDAVFFDFDGVILDSVNVKTEAFAAMFRQYGPDVEKAVVEYHLANGGVSRFEKFRYYYTRLLDKPIDQETLDNLGQVFNRLVLDKVLAAPFIPGAQKTLKQLKQDGIPAFVVSGTPDEEIKLIVDKRGLSPYFAEVHGSPKKKSEIVNDIAGRFGYRLHKSLFVGDAMTDYDAARACGMQFLGIVEEGKMSPFPENTLIDSQLLIG